MPVASTAGVAQPTPAPGQQKHVNPADVHVLLVDDERLSRTVIGNLLKKCQYKVTVVESGVEALEMLKQKGPGAFNLVLTDVMMPDVSGLELLQHVRKNGELQTVPVIMMSANECQDMVWKCVEQGAEDYLLKPLTKKEVQNIWTHVFRRQQQHARVPRLSTEDSMEDSSRQDSLGVQSAEAPLHPSQSALPSPRPEPTSSSSLPRHASAQQAAACAEPPSSSAAAPPLAEPSAPPESALPAPIHPLDNCMKKAALEARRASHARASSSQVPSSRGATSPGPAQAAGAEVVAMLPPRNGDSISLADYLAARGSSLCPAISFRIFCSLLNLIQSSHKENHPCTFLRPSTLWLTADSLMARPGGLSSLEPQQQLEQQLYASPEELAGEPRTHRSDVFGLALLFCVLFYGLDSITAEGQIEAARLGRVPLQVEKNSLAAQFLGALLQPDPHRRPKLDQVAHTKMVAILHKSVMGDAAVRAEPSAATKPAKALPPAHSTLTTSQQQILCWQAHEDAVDREVLADFLQQVRQVKQLEASGIRRQMAMLDTDIKRVGAFLQQHQQPHGPATASLSGPNASQLLPLPAPGAETRAFPQSGNGATAPQHSTRASHADPDRSSQPRKRQKVEAPDRAGGVSPTHHLSQTRAGAASPTHHLSQTRAGAASPTHHLSQTLLWHKRRQQRAMADEEDDMCNSSGDLDPDGLPADASHSLHEAPSWESSGHAAAPKGHGAAQHQSAHASAGGGGDSPNAAHPSAAARPSDLAQPDAAQQEHAHAAPGSRAHSEGSDSRSHAEATQHECCGPSGADPGNPAKQQLHEHARGLEMDCEGDQRQDPDSSTHKDGAKEKQAVSGVQPAGVKRKHEEAGASGNDSDDGCCGSIDERWQRIAAAFSPLEQLFFHPELSAALSGRQASAAAAVPEAPGQPLPHLGSHLETFSEHLGKASCYGNFKVQATLNYGNLPNTANMVCSAAFDRDGEYFATAGVNRGIKVFEMAMVLDDSVSTHYPLLKIPARSKLSSLCWNGYIKSSLICADYDGVIQLWDIASASDVMQFDEHSRRVWSVDFSQTDPTCFLSGSDDNTVRLWSLRDEGSVATIDAHANVCSVQFSPVNSNLIAFGSANYKSFLYDMRQMARPLAVIAGHNRAVSYVRFMGASQLATASTDNTLKLWDIQSASSAPLLTKPLTTFSGHVNEKNFVGLSVTPDGYIACGSEDNSVYAYYKALPSPVTQHRFSCNDPTASEDYCFDPLESHQFMSSVCWSQKSHTLLAANSLGTIKLLQLAA